MDLEKPTTADKFIGTIAEKLGAVARAATVFGEPVERNGVTVIPVARARWGFGGGAGQRKRGAAVNSERGTGAEEDGAGGGGGVTVSPVGFIEIRSGQAEFRPIRSTARPWLIAGGLATIFLVRQLLKRLP